MYIFSLLRLNSAIHQQILLRCLKPVYQDKQLHLRTLLLMLTTASYLHPMESVFRQQGDVQSGKDYKVIAWKPGLLRKVHLD